MLGAFLGAAAISGAAGLGSSMLSQYYNKKNMKKQAELEYQYAQRYAMNAPSWNVQGLRAAGLNPILAVSNGVNLGANIPNITNSSPKADIDIPAVEALKAAKEAELGQQNANSTSEMADAQATTADANMLRAKADVALKQAQTAETIQRTQRVNSNKYSSPLVRDVMGLMDDIKKQSADIVREASAYIDNTPKISSRRSPVSTSDKVHHADERLKQSNSILDRTWRSNKRGPDGIRFLRKQSDIGGVMHMYR